MFNNNNRMGMYVSSSGVMSSMHLLVYQPVRSPIFISITVDSLEIKFYSGGGTKVEGS